MPRVKQVRLSDATIGNHLDWAINVCERAEMASDERFIGSRSAAFVTDMMAKFEEYGSSTYVSQAQMEWLERIETALDDNGL